MATVLMFVVLTALAAVILYGVYGAWRKHETHQRRMALERRIAEQFGPEFIERFVRTVEELSRYVTETLTPTIHKTADAIREFAKAWDSVTVLSDRSGKPVYVRTTRQRRR